jgi:hypothetical protein
VAFSEALDVRYWEMRPALYCRICLVIEIISKEGVFYVSSILLSSTT